MFGDAADGGQDGRRACSQTASTSPPSAIPVVPQGKARIRVQLSAAHSADDVEACVRAFVKQPAERRRRLATADGPPDSCKDVAMAATMTW